MKSGTYLDQLKPEESAKLYLTTKMFAHTRLAELGFSLRLLGVKTA